MHATAVVRRPNEARRVTISRARGSRNGSASAVCGGRSVFQAAVPDSRGRATPSSLMLRAEPVVRMDVNS